MSDLKPTYVEFHVLRSYPPSNLNRDDLGSPKSIVFGGERRVRVSSQCLKRTWRMSPFFRGSFAEAELGIRTQRVPQEVFAKLGPDYDDKARLVLEALFAALGKGSGKPAVDDGESDEASADGEAVEAAAAPSVAAADAAKTDFLLFLSQQEIDQIVEFAHERAADITKAIKAGKKKAGVDSKALDKLREELKKHLAKTCSRNAVDVALFGRFLTSGEFRECNAALQVAHALGTQKLDLEYDYFTAVDDKQPSAEPGAGHIGETELCASVMYEYAVCDLSVLMKNLGGDRALSAKALGAIAQAMCRSIFEKAKRNGTAPHTPADFIEIVIRKDAPVSLANAFLKPIRAAGAGDVMDQSIASLRQQATKYDAAYGDEGVERLRLCLREVEGATPTHTSLAELAADLEKKLSLAGAA